MEFYEKLQELRKNRGLTQEELAEILFVSRTAVSKWESGRGMPNIESLKGISKYFAVSLDDLLSSEELLVIAEDENKANIQKMCQFLFGMMDVMAVSMIILPLYPYTVDDYVYSVNLINYMETSTFHRVIYWMLFCALMMIGIIKIYLTKVQSEKNSDRLTTMSIGISSVSILYLAMSREAYAVSIAFILLVIKGMLLFKCKGGGMKGENKHV